MKIFTPEDFERASYHPEVRFCAAFIANAMVEKLMGPQIYFNDPNGSLKHIIPSFMDPANDQNLKNNTHSAYLFNIQEIPRKPCDHIYSEFAVQKVNMNFYGKCKVCGKEVVAKWEVADA